MNSCTLVPPLISNSILASIQQINISNYASFQQELFIIIESKLYKKFRRRENLKNVPLDLLI